MAEQGYELLEQEEEKEETIVIQKGKKQEKKKEKQVGKKYKASNGARFDNAKAQIVGQELEKIKNENGVLNPTIILDKAKNSSSPIHDLFDWDNSVASEKWRLQQARELTNHIVEVMVVNGKEIEERAFFSVTVKNEEGKNKSIYVTLSEAITTPDYRRQLLNEMQTHLENVLRIIKLFSGLDK